MGRLKTEGAPADGTDAHRQLSDALIITVQGIAAGMNNTAKPRRSVDGETEDHVLCERRW